MKDPFTALFNESQAPDTDTAEESAEPEALATPAPATPTPAAPAEPAPEVPVPDPEAEDGQTPPVYPNVGEWVDDWLLPNFRRELGGSKRRWDPNWWRYEEAGGALEALWEAWEHLRLQGGTANAVFYRDYLYPIMDRLTATDGPFWNFHETPEPVPGNIIPPIWETAPTPEGWYRKKDDPREQ